MTDVAMETITPEKAESYLAHNQTNRKLRWSVVDRYAEDMKAGNWRVGGATIDFDENNNLLNGQHRLHACVRAAVPLTAVVVRGLAGDTQEVMDVGLRRSLNDTLAYRGEINTAALAASINMSWRWQQGLILGAVHPSHPQALNWLARNPSIRDAVSRCNFLRQQILVPSSAAGAFIHQISRIDYEEAESFLKHLREGDGLTAGDPILALRNWMVSQLTGGVRRAKPSAPMYLALSVKAWNAWIQGRSVSFLRWRRGGEKKEGFPELLDVDGNRFPLTDEIPAA